MVDIGNALVQAQQTLLANIQCIDPIYAQFDVSARNDLLRFMKMLRENELPDPEKTSADSPFGPAQ